MPLVLRAVLFNRHEYHGHRREAAGIKINPQTGEMTVGLQILMPPFDFDLVDAAKGRAKAGPSGPATTQNARPANWK